MQRNGILRLTSYIMLCFDVLLIKQCPVGKITEKAICMSVFLMEQHFECELTKTHSFRLLFWRFCPLGS